VTDLQQILVTIVAPCDGDDDDDDDSAADDGGADDPAWAVAVPLLHSHPWDSILPGAVVESCEEPL
jgi:hypothetical protein